MAELGAPRLRLYLFCAACALFGMGYGRTRVVGAYDAGLLFYITWPLSVPWYAVRTRGRAGLRLTAQLYALAFSGQLGYIFGATIRFFLFESSASAA